jgi:hypothetical protein
MYFIELPFDRDYILTARPGTIWEAVSVFLRAADNLQSLDGASLAGGLVRIDDDTVQLRAVLGRFHPAIQTREKSANDHVFVDAND